MTNAHFGDGAGGVVREVGDGELKSGEPASVWLLSEDSAAASEIAIALKQVVGSRVRPLSIASWSFGRAPRSRPECLVVDLRSSDAWEYFQKCPDEWTRLRERRVPVIGIVGSGFPRSCAVQADQSLTAAVAWPAPASRLVDVFRDGVRAHGRSSHDHAGIPRVLEGATLRFESYTPTLFPVIEDLVVAARHEYNMLVVGETGTGKTTLAKLVHEISPRCQERFLVVSCGALPSELMGSELFGHVKGAFTGADKTKIGKFEVADRGTIVLEEIDTLDLMQQAKLLRIIESGEFEPVGSNETKMANARVIVTSNVNLEDMVAAGRFRSDLYFRLRQLRFDLPPLRQRRQDIVPLAMAMLDECCRAKGFSIDRIHPEFLDLLKSHSWPGNLRDLRNEIQRAALFCRNGFLTPELLSPAMVKDAQKAIEQGETGALKTGLADDVERTEIEAIERMLRATEFNRSATARALGISRVTLYNKIRKYRIRLDGDNREEV